MSKLEDLVPPLELCKQIPAGAFADSALVWYRATISGEYVLLPRQYQRNVDAARTVAPAPTLEEIMDVLPEYTTVYHNGPLYRAYTLATGEMRCGTDQNAASAALRLALSLNDPSRLDAPATPGSGPVDQNRHFQEDKK